MQTAPKSQGLPLYLIRHLDGTGGRIQTYESGSQSPLPYRLATPVYLCTSPPNPDSPQRTSNSFLRPTGHGLFYLSFCYHYEVHERRNFSCLYERNKRLSGVRDRRLSGFSYFGRRNLKQRRPHALIYFYNQSYNFSSSF